MNALTLSLLALAGVCILFTFVFLYARKLDNYGVVDAAWAYSFGVIALFYGLSAAGWTHRRILIVALVAIASFRLGTHLFVRIRKHHPKEDTRYAEMRNRWADHFERDMFGFYQLQAVSLILLSIPFVLICTNPETSWHLLEILGAGLWLIAFLGETIADAQLSAFSHDPANKGKVCDVGLWRYSRHPNYFFQWLLWVSYFVIACGSPWGWLSVLSPLCILYLLLRVTGIPMTEAQSLRNRGERYRHYQERTSAFIPWPPKAKPSAPSSSR